VHLSKSPFQRGVSGNGKVHVNGRGVENVPWTCYVGTAISQQFRRKNDKKRTSEMSFKQRMPFIRNPNPNPSTNPKTPTPTPSPKAIGFHQPGGEVLPFDTRNMQMLSALPRCFSLVTSAFPTLFPPDDAAVGVNSSSFRACR